MLSDPHGGLQVLGRDWSQSPRTGHMLSDPEKQLGKKVTVYGLNPLERVTCFQT